MELPRIAGTAAANNALEDSMQFNANYSIISRDERSFIQRNNLQTTHSTLVGIEKGDISWMVPDEISLFQSRIMGPNESRLPPEGAERRTRAGNTNGDLDISNLSDCTQYKELLQLINKYDLEDVSVSEVPDKILPPIGGKTYRERINKQRAEGDDIPVPSTEQLLAVLKETEGLTPSKIYDRIIESSFPKRTDPKLSESDMDITSCGRPEMQKSRYGQTIDQPFKVRAPIQPSQDSFFDFKNTNSIMGDSSFVPMSISILEKDEKSILAKYGGLTKQADITCPADQPTLPWNVSNVTIFDVEPSGSLPRRRLEDSVRKLADVTSLKSVPCDTSQLDDLAERIYALSPSTSFSAISKMILDSTRTHCDEAVQNVTGKR